MAASLPPGSRVADVGAGDAPYRELFAHTRYTTIDWEHSVHPGARASDIVSPADAIAAPDGTFDAVVCMQVLEHVPDPGRVLAEFHRILAPGGSVHLTVPLVWELHELPHDYYRYTAPALEFLLGAAGFGDIEVEARNDCFTTVAQLLRNLHWTMGRAPDGLDGQREEAGAVLVELADMVAALAPLDVNRIFPLGYSASARKPKALKRRPPASAKARRG